MSQAATKTFPVTLKKVTNEHLSWIYEHDRSYGFFVDHNTIFFYGEELAIQFVLSNNLS